MRNFKSASQKWYIVGLMMVFLSVALVGCGTEKSKEPAPQQNAQPVTLLVSAAASLTDVLADIEKEYQKEHPNVSFDFNLGSSGSLQEQIANGAPADVFISAAKNKMDALEEKDLIVKETRKDVVKNTLVLIVANDNDNIKNFADLENAKTIAMGEPESVPVGKYATEALTSLNLIDKLKAKMVYAKDVRQVLAYVESGDAEAGLVYQTDANISQKVKVAAVADENLHSSLVYPAAVVKESKNQAEAKAFVDFLSSDKATKLFKKYGFTVIE
ncbi:Molybdenum ABC transporter, periplasmic binding protein [Syntrophomonas zehnderi OL-4]|uniref:Molybdenum ABC transporter, periplasmic binding protein n=1 Tax=Syntrophomonas zehnderi OL-4 TaxID=690567 RepID=A0A0E4GAS1_9FIRM|nr:molybdate ABC transporter substrate-binding protein [Syntrophomonas zehnderi]CFX62195.1 Molybdenum ABC transporter, periplasmic binding protein [Syntrophomonas zehnderi OL-4]